MSNFGRSSTATQEGVAGRPNTGSGGGGGAVADGRLGGNGASGIVIVRYSLDSGIVATGGSNQKDITVGGTNYRVHYFTSSSNFVVSELGTGVIDYLIVGGGGGGSYNNTYGSGGGGGGVREGSTTLTSATSYAITVGLGGNRATTTNTAGQIGGSSVAFGLTAGGGLGSLNRSASGTPQSNPAFSGPSSDPSYGAGGAGGPGQFARGGPGYLSAIDGEGKRYAAGGGSGRTGIPGGLSEFDSVFMIFNDVEEYRIEVITEVVVPIQRKSFIFHQRVYSESQGWCYYSTTTETNGQPSSVDTDPNHQNDISDHQLIAITVLIEESEEE
jgi:hypothetical protein